MFANVACLPGDEFHLTRRRQFQCRLLCVRRSSPRRQDAEQGCRMDGFVITTEQDLVQFREVLTIERIMSRL